MNTPAHIALNLVLLGRRERLDETLVIAVGSALPDLTMLTFYFWEKVIRHVPEPLIWSREYHDTAWQAIFDGIHSVPLLLIALVVSFYLGGRRPLLLFAAMILHSLEDLPLHHADAHRHLFPLSEWRFHSPVSYWDPSHYGHITAPLEGLLFGLCCLLLARRATSSHARLFLGLLVLVYALYWGYVFWIWA